MHKIIELYEQVDEVNYFLKEWQRLSNINDPTAKIVNKPEMHFIAHAIEHLIKQADSLEVPLTLQIGNEAVLARQGRRHVAHKNKKHFNWLIPSRSTIKLTDFKKFTNSSGRKTTYVGNKNGLMTLLSLSQTVARGGELRLNGHNTGDWYSI